MKTAYALCLSLLLLLVSACATKVNDPSDIEAVKKSVADFEKAVNASDAAGIGALMTDKTLFAGPNSPVATGKEEIQYMYRALFGAFTTEFKCTVADVRVTGDLAVARGTWTEKNSPKVAGVAPVISKGSWIVAFARQSDGAWKWDWVVPNSDQPLPGSTETGDDEQALYQLERDWAAAGMKNDAKTIERFLADEFISTWDGKITNKRQVLTETKNSQAKIESAQNEDMQVVVFGNIAIVHGKYVEKSTTLGRDSSAQFSYAEVYIRRDGRWQCVTQYGTKVQ